MPQSFTIESEGPHASSPGQGRTPFVTAELHKSPGHFSKAELLFEDAKRQAVTVVEAFNPSERAAFARSFCSAVLAEYWKRQCEINCCNIRLRESVVQPTDDFFVLSQRAAHAAAQIRPSVAGFRIGQLYTALLPDVLQKKLGAYYTPPSLVERLLFLATEAGFKWETGRIIDPACGGAAFLASLAPRLLREMGGSSPEAIFREFQHRLVGLEIDQFASWMSQVLLDVALIELCKCAGKLGPQLVISEDSLSMDTTKLGDFDLVIGNPPYGKVTLDPKLRESYNASLFGHANLYGLFTHLAVQLTRPGGLIAFVTPTSFLGGEYFKNLRKLLGMHAPLRRIDFVRDREGVFEGVLQETALAIFRKKPLTPARVWVQTLEPTQKGVGLNVKDIGKVVIKSKKGEPWFLPRLPTQLRLIETLARMPHRLADYNFAVATGQLVWNRHKEQLRQKSGAGCYPIVWAESITPTGEFRFQAERSTHLPYLKVLPKQEFLVNYEPCVVVQRTTAKEQRRRLVAATLPNIFVVDGFVVENHVNMILPNTRKPSLSLRALTVLLNSEVVDQAFRCINGSVAVSAYELNSLPLPSPLRMAYIQARIENGAASAEVETLLSETYGLTAV